MSDVTALLKPLKDRLSDSVASNEDEFAAIENQAKLIAAIEAVERIADDLDAKVVIASENPAAKSHVANRIRAALTQALGGDTA